MVTVVPPVKNVLAGVNVRIPIQAVLLVILLTVGMGPVVNQVMAAVVAVVVAQPLNHLVVLRQKSATVLVPTLKGSAPVT